MRIAALIATLAAFGAQASEPQTQKTPKTPAHEMPKPSDELKAEHWFVGTWTCKGHARAGPMGPEHQVESRIVFKMELAGFWLHYTGTALAGPMKGRETLNGLAGWAGDHHEPRRQPSVAWLDSAVISRV